MTSSPHATPGTATTDAEAALRTGDRVFAAAVDAMDVIAIAIGDRLGYYQALDSGPTTPDALAQATRTSRRYCRESPGTGPARAGWKSSPTHG